MKTCSKCSVAKPASGFSSSRAAKCRECVKKYNAEYASKNRQKIRDVGLAWRKKHREELRKKAIEYYHENRQAYAARKKNWYETNKTQFIVKVKKWKKETVVGFFYSKLQRLKNNAKNRGLEINIDHKYLMKLYEDQKEMCPLTGRKLLLMKGSEDIPDRLSVDRVDPEKGYVSGNVRLVTWQANSARRSWDDHQLLKFAKDVVKTLTRHSKETP
jgi:hypothetical protein